MPKIWVAFCHFKVGGKKVSNIRYADDRDIAGTIVSKP